MPKTKVEAPYEVPDYEYEMLEEDKTLATLSKGDQLVNGTRIGEVIRGHKYVTVKATNGQQLWRELVETAQDMQLTVLVKRSTEESRQRVRRADANNKLVDLLLGWEKQWTQTQASVIEDIQTLSGGWGQVRYGVYEKLMAADAERWVWAGFANMVENAQDPESKLFGTDHIELFEMYCEQLKERILSRSTRSFYPFSRSTSTISNLMEDVEVKACSDFLDTLRYHY